MKSPHCGVLYKENERRGGWEAALSLCSGFLSCKQVLPSRAFHMQLCLGGPGEGRRQRCVVDCLSVGPTWAGASPVISSTLFGFPQTHSVPRRGKRSAPTLSVLRNVVSCGQDPREEAHQNRHCSLLSASGSSQRCHKAPQFTPTKLQRC